MSARLELPGQASRGRGRPGRHRRERPRRSARPPRALVLAALFVLLAGLVVTPSASASAQTTAVYAYADGGATGPASCPATSTRADQCTLAQALSHVGPGGTVYLATPGSTAHYVGNWTLAVSGTSADSPVTITGAADLSSGPVLDGNQGNASGCSTTACDGTILTIPGWMAVRIDGVTFMNGMNTTSVHGGAINYGDGNTFQSGGLWVSNSTFVGNGANHGGAIDNGDSEGRAYLYVWNSTFVDNVANYGGAIANGHTSGLGLDPTKSPSAQLHVWSSTFTGNQATVPGAGHAINNTDGGHGVYGADVYLAGNVIAAADNGACGNLYLASSWHDLGYNVASDGTCTRGATGDVVSAAAGQLGDLADNGGPTPTVALESDNPAAMLVPEPVTLRLDDRDVTLCPRTDQRGQRTRDGAGCSVGALEQYFEHQSIEFGSLPEDPAAGESYPVVATATSGLPVTVTVDPYSAGVCAVAGSPTTGFTVSFEAGGTCEIHATQAGDDSYLPAHAEQTMTVTGSKPTQTISLTDPLPAPTWPGDRYRISASATSGLPVTLTIDPSSDAGTCSVAGTTATFHHPGTCVIDANQAGSDVFEPAQAQFTVAVAPSVPTAYAYVGSGGTSTTCAQTATVGEQCTLGQALRAVTADGTVYLATPGAAAHYVGNWSVSKTGGAGPLTIAPVPGLASGPVLDGNDGESDGCSTSGCAGSILRIRGTTSVDISGVTFAHGRAGTGGAITNGGSGTLTVSGVTFTANTATASFGYGGAIANGVDGSSGTVHVSDSTFIDNSAPEGFGGAIANGVRTDDLNHPDTAVLTVTGSTFSDNAAVVGGAIANSVSFDPSRGTNGTTTVSDSTFRENTASGELWYAQFQVLNRGGAIATAYGGSSNWGTLTVSRSLFDRNTSEISGRAISDGAGDGYAYTNGGDLKVSDSTFSGDDTQPAIDAILPSEPGTDLEATIVRSTVVGGMRSTGVLVSTGNLITGSCSYWSLTDPGYNAATDANCLNGGPGSVQSDRVADLAALSADGVLVPTAGNPALGLIPNAATVTIDDAPLALCPRIDQLGRHSRTRAACDAGAFETQTSSAQTVAFAAPATGTVGEAIDLSGAVTASSGLPVALSVDAGASVPSDACSVSGSTVTLVHAGTCVLNADQPGDDAYAPAPQVTATIAVGRASQAISFTPPGSGTVGRTATLTAAGGGSGNPVTFSVDAAASSPSDACSLSGSRVSFVRAGTCAIDADQAGNDDYAAAPRVTATITVNESDSTGGTDGSAGTVTYPVGAGDSASSSAGSTPSASTPVVATVTSPRAGQVTFTLQGAGATQTGYTMLGQSFHITAPPATAADPLRLSFRVADAALPAGADPSALTVFRDGQAIPGCTDPDATAAEPDPCVIEHRNDGAVTTVTVLTSHASTWAFGVGDAPAVDEVRVAPARPYASAGKRQSIVARVVDADGRFVPDATVHFAVTGANPTSGTARTGAHGALAHFHYRAEHAGTDTITATSGGRSATVTVRIVGPVPWLGAISRSAGTINVAFDPVRPTGLDPFGAPSRPVVPIGQKVRVYVIKHPHSAHPVLLRAGYIRIDRSGRAHGVLNVFAYLDGSIHHFRSGGRYVLRARVAGSHYLSDRVLVTVD